TPSGTTVAKSVRRESLGLVLISQIYILLALNRIMEMGLSGSNPWLAQICAKFLLKRVCKKSHRGTFQPWKDFSQR
ncbi:MAG: hypothetical protein JJT96_19195, partial [Opitutales bacterium]|nr:hypothetical protein [Opitutales bacterium]